MPTKSVAKTPYELWIGRKPSLKHLHVWECSTKVRPYKPHENKLEPKIVSNYFIGYTKRSKGFKFYDPTTRNIFKMGTATFFEDIEFRGEIRLKSFFLKKNWFLFLNRFIQLFLLPLKIR